MGAVSLEIGEEPFITYDWDGSYMDFVHEADALIKRHWEEVGTHRDIIPLDPDHERYRFAERAGMLYVLKARDHGSLVGYFGLSVIRYPRSKSVRMGMDEFIYAMPEYRRHHVGAEMIRRGITKLDELGCHIIAFREPTRRKNGGYLKRFGFEPKELVYTKVLRAPGKGGAE